MEECFSLKEFQEKVCPKCKNTSNSLCKIVRKINGMYGCPEFEEEKEDEQKI